MSGPSVAVAFVAFFLAYAATAVAISRGARTRISEERRNADHDRVRPHQIGWHITHLRDDVSGLAGETESLQG